MGPRENEPLSELMQRHALETLRWHWAGAYEFSVRADGRWLAVRADGLGEVTAADAGELSEAVQKDYSARPVPREPGTRTDALDS